MVIRHVPCLGTTVLLTPAADAVAGSAASAGDTASTTASAPGQSSLLHTHGVRLTSPQACVLVTCLLVAALGADAGLLKVPRVYNALITSKEPLLPSRTYSVSSPVALLSTPYVALEPALIGPPASYSSEPEAPPTPAPEEAPASTPQPPAAKAPTADAVPPTLSVAYGSGVPFPLTFYNHLGYSPFSYYPSFLAYHYPLVTPGLGLQFALPQAAGAGAVLPQDAAEAAPPPALPPTEFVKNNKPENTAVPDVSPPPPPSGAARADDKAAEAA